MGARGSGDCFDFPAAFLFDGMTGSRDNDIDKLSPQGGVLILSYIRRLWLFFFWGGGFKILNFNIFWGFQKNEYFLGIKILRIFFFFFFFWGGGGGGHHNIGLYLGAISMHFSVFFKFNVQIGEYFFSC